MVPIHSGVHMRGRVPGNRKNYPLSLRAFPAAMMKYLLFPARSAFIALVTVNLFGIAKKLWAAMDDQKKYQAVIDSWKKMGGNPGKLVGAIHDGANLPEPIKGKWSWWKFFLFIIRCFIIGYCVTHFIHLLEK